MVTPRTDSATRFPSAKGRRDEREAEEGTIYRAPTKKSRAEMSRPRALLIEVDAVARGAFEAQAKLKGRVGQRFHVSHAEGDTRRVYHACNMLSG